MTTTSKPAGNARAPASRKPVTMERTFAAPVEAIWELWTTREGFEAWWGPEGFEVKVRSIDLRPGGDLAYAMIATGADQIAFMKSAGMPVVNEHRLTFTEIAPLRRLAYVHLADFIPGVAPYEVATVVELHPGADGVRMTLSFDPMHDDQWTRMAEMGWAEQLGKLARVVAGRAPAQKIT